MTRLPVAFLSFYRPLVFVFVLYRELILGIVLRGAIRIHLSASAVHIYLNRYASPTCRPRTVGMNFDADLGMLSPTGYSCHVIESFSGSLLLLVVDARLAGACLLIKRACHLNFCGRIHNV